MLQPLCCGVPSSLLKPSNGHILPGLEESKAPICQRGNPTVAVVIHGAALEASYVQRLCVLLGRQCCVCAGMWLQVGLSQARTSRTASFLQNQITKYREGGNFVSKTEYGVFFRTLQESKTREETKQGYFSRPVRQPEQR